MTKRHALKCWTTVEAWDDTTDDAIVTISPAVAPRWLTCRKAFDLTPDLMSLETTSSMTKSRGVTILDARS